MAESSHEVVQPSDDLREIRRLQPLIHAATVTAGNVRRGTTASTAADEHLDALLSELAVVQERAYGRPPKGWMDIVERAELAVTWCSDNYHASGIRDLAATAEPYKRAMSQLVDAVLTVAEGCRRQAMSVSEVVSNRNGQPRGWSG